MMRARESGVELLQDVVRSFFTLAGWLLCFVSACLILLLLLSPFLPRAGRLSTVVLGRLVVCSRPFARMCCRLDAFHAPLMHKGASRG